MTAPGQGLVGRRPEQADVLHLLVRRQIAPVPQRHGADFLLGARGGSLRRGAEVLELSAAGRADAARPPVLGVGRQDLDRGPSWKPSDTSGQAYPFLASSMPWCRRRAAPQGRLSAGVATREWWRGWHYLTRCRWVCGWR